MSVEKKVIKKFKRNLNFCHLLKLRIILEIGSLRLLVLSKPLGNIYSIVNQKKAKLL